MRHGLSGSGLKGTLIGVAKTAAGVAARGARLAGLKARIEKVRRMDLVAAHAALGAAAYALRASPDCFQPVYDQIAAVENEMEQKRKGVKADPYATLVQKARVMLSSAKLKLEAEALAFKRKTLFESLGRLITDAKPAMPELRQQQQAVARVSARLDLLSRRYDEAKGVAYPFATPDAGTQGAAPPAKETGT